VNDQLLAAAGKGDVATVAALLAKGADVNAENELRATPLYIACELGHVDLVKLLLDHGANPDAKDLEFGRTPLRNASVPAKDARQRDARAEIVKLLIQKGAGSDGESLVELIDRGYSDAVRTIVARGRVDPSFLNLSLAAAKRTQQPELIDLLIKAGATDPTPLDSPRAPARLAKLAGVYRNATGGELTLSSGLYEDRIMLERPGRARVSLLPLDFTTLRTFDYKVVLTLAPGSVPPTIVTLSDGTRSEKFMRVAGTQTPVSSASGPPSVSPPGRVEPRTADLPPEPEPGAPHEWGSFRGPSGSGVADGARLPTTWDLENGVNIKWKTPIPGLAHSSPIIWGDRVFVTSAVPKTDNGVAFLHGTAAGSTADAANRMTKDSVVHSWRVFALEKQSGRIVWERVAHEGVPRTARHVMASQADPTPATDGQHLVVFFGSEGLYCYDLNGKLLWHRDLGPLTSGYIVDPTYEWTVASSPIIYKNRVILQVDLLKNSFIAAFDINTGKGIWRTERDEVPSWSTPLLFAGPGRTELVTVAPKFARGYDPDTGKELWRMGKHSTYATPAPVAGRGLIFLTSGSGGTIQPIYAVRPGATGNITLGDDEASNGSIVWSKDRGGSFIPTPILYGDLLYVCSDTGILAAYKADTGERLYQQRLTRGGGYAASGVAADGYLYFPSEDGDVIVVKAGSRFEKVAENHMGEVIMASPAISRGLIIFRTQHHVVAVAESTPDR
jgi:outer membrane protein assembly factor BamB